MKWIVCTLLMMSTMVWAANEEDDDNNEVSFDSIVSELKTSTEDIKPVQDFNDPWEQIGVYGGLGLAANYLDLQIPGATRTSGILKGLQAHFGIDLFTKYLRAEGAFRAFAQDSIDSNVHASLKEFELRTVLLPAPYAKNTLRLGLGLSARYLDVASRNTLNGWRNQSTSTPASVLSMGVERKISKNFSVGPDLSYRSALIEDTFDKSSWDFCLKMDANF